jgi:hypothetical protein
MLRDLVVILIFSLIQMLLIEKICHSLAGVDVQQKIVSVFEENALADKYVSHHQSGGDRTYKINNYVMLVGYARVGYEPIIDYFTY